MHSLSKFILLPAFILLFLSISVSAAEKESAYDRVIRTGHIKCGYIVWPPYFDRNANTGAVTGLSKDASDAIFRLLQLKAEYVEVIYGAQVEDLRSGKIDAMCGEGPWVIASTKYMEYSEPFYFAPLKIYGRMGETRFSKRNDLNQKDVRFVGIDGDISLQLAELHFPKAKLKTLPGSSDASTLLMDITAGKADAGILDPLAVEKFNKSNAKKVTALGGQSFIAVNKAGFAVLKGEVQLLNTLDEALKAAWNIGVMDQVLDRYDPDKKLLLRPAAPYQK